MLKRRAKSFQVQNSIISHGEIMKRNFGDFVCKRLSCPGAVLLAVSLIVSIFLVGCGANRASSSKSSSNEQALDTKDGKATNRASSSTSGSNSQPSHSDHAETTPTPRIPAYFSSGEGAKPFPAVLDPRQFSDPAVAKAYRYAQEIPEVFSQQPCYCLCDAGSGHRSLLDCFATDHGAG